MAIEQLKRLEKLDEMAFAIEVTLISLVQGVVLGVLAAKAEDVIVNMRFEYWPYVAVGLIYILYFWTASIVHALSFVRWPFDLVHNTLYFIIAFLQMLTLSRLANPAQWFLFNAILYTAAWITYAIDLRIIHQSKVHYIKASEQGLFTDMMREQKLGLYCLIPLGIIYSLVAYYLVMSGFNHLTLVTLQLLIGLAIIGYTFYRFRARARLIANSLV